MKAKFVKASDIAENKKLSLSPRDYIDPTQREELAAEAFARGGMGAYNEARGFDSQSPEPCGHHCGWDCPRCGEDAYHFGFDEDDR